jgi:endonuclease III
MSAACPFLRAESSGTDSNMTDRKERIGAKDLGIDLDKGTDTQVFHWLIACQLFGARINQEIAARTYRELEKERLLSPKALAESDWRHLSDVLERGGYTRYKESTARELIDVGRHAQERYSGKITRIRRAENGDSASKKIVTERLKEFNGVGPTAARIFLRHMAPIWNL